jgi:hypothetical protein
MWKPWKLLRYIPLVETHTTFGQQIWSLLSSLGIVGGTGIAMGWLASATEWLNAYGPIAYGGIGLASAFVAAGALALIGVGRERLSRVQLNARLATTPTTVNPLEDTFQRVRINVADFECPFNQLYQGKTFIKCELTGPANVIFFGSVNIEDSPRIDCEFVSYNRKVKIRNAIVFENPTFRGCVLYRLTIFVPEEGAAAMDKALGDIKWLNKPAICPGRDTPIDR